MRCEKCGSPTGLVGLCLPCRKDVQAISKGAAAVTPPAVCRRCGEPLRDRKSRQRGYGPTCWVLRQVERNQT